MTAWLLTWMWQGMALVVSLRFALRLLPSVNAATRYLLWWGAFAALVLLGWQSLPQAALAVLPEAAFPASAGSALPGTRMPRVSVPPLPFSVLAGIALVWVSVALFRLLRVASGLYALSRLKRECRPFPRSVGAQLPLWREASGRSVRLSVCAGVPGAALLGLRAPCIAIPPTFIRDLSASDLDQIILHEYGHVQRRDDWMRLLQALIESALWLHPAAFVIGRELNLEREVACDDWVIARTGSPAAYARCLSRVAERRCARVTPVLAQALFGGHRDLYWRVDRLLDAGRNTDRRPAWQVAALGTAAFVVCVVILRAVPLVVDAARAPERMAPLVVAAGAAEDPRPMPDAVEPVTIQVKARASRRQEQVAPPPREVDVVVRPADIAPTPPREADEVSVKTPVLEATRVFEGLYADQEPGAAPVRSVRRLVAPWQAVGDAGVGIGSATQKASVSLADAVSKAGTAVARSF